MLKLFEGPSIIYTVLGLVVFAAALLPRLLRRAPISMPMVFLAAGVLAFALIDYLPTPDPVKYETATTHLTEVCVIISLMGAGLALDRPIGWRTWSTTWRLLAIVMPLCILVFAVLGYLFLGLGIASAILIGAALAPTDPVLASEVQVGEPADGEEGFDREDEVRFGLTSEAGLNDGLAFPFVYLAITISLAGAGASSLSWLPQWFAVDVLWRIGFGVLLGYGTGKLLGRLFFSSRRESFRLSNHSEGFVALAATFLAYGVTETFEGYGFIAVFVCAITIRAAERDHGFHRVLHSYVEQLERLLSVVILVLLGGAIARGLLETIGWTDVVLALVLLIIVRPLAGFIGLLGGPPGVREKVALAFFGVRGIGSLYYLGYGLSNGQFDAEANEVWAFVGLVVALSVVLHGVTATPVMLTLDRLRSRKAGKDDRDSNVHV
ncbi:cation:proton antiporter [Arthrobacter sp. JZ12]|uniref:cation:proton antiporter n=1 Tax=Arthrobacter sp. JZ12 TaxID=2654190 RepID=UPI002B485480|nr:cation:proton antiporter [Arthrobacter sp. JZ12]